MAKGSKKMVGDEGEDLAASWLSSAGFSILHRNWRSGRYEIDIIAEKDGVLHFIEVKTRRSARYGNPEVQVGREKLRHMIDAGSAFIDLHEGWKRIRFDILAIKRYKGMPVEFLLIEDVYL